MCSNLSLAVFPLPLFMAPFQLIQSDQFPFAISHQGLDRALHCLWGTPEKFELTMHAVAGYWKPAGEVSTSSSGIGSPQSNALSE